MWSSRSSREDKCIRFSNHGGGGAGNKRNSFPYESSSKDVERNIPKKMASGP